MSAQELREFDRSAQLLAETDALADPEYQAYLDGLSPKEQEKLLRKQLWKDRLWLPLDGTWWLIKLPFRTTWWIMAAPFRLLIWLARR